ncbi:MAG TPA: response regulator [Myxococcota bacterium]|nr:response regulator [Myxococcota bacterium]HRY95142.1 response regulator [Myxococcota bacterium]HSA24321.1 response regulator [Myxococcota bacterium]
MAGKRVLYVEDDEANFLLVARALARWPELEVQRARDGLEGLRLARATPPDLVLVDMHLPGMDGLELTRALRAEPGLARTPVVALTANVLRGERERALGAGCDEFIGKPFSLRAFRQVVARVLGLGSPE